MVGARLEVAAMVAKQDAAEAVFHQPGRAVGALEAVAAGPAERQRRIAPAVEEEERLLALGQRLADGGDQRRREVPAALGRVLAEVDRRDSGSARRGVRSGSTILRSGRRRR